MKRSTDLVKSFPDEANVREILDTFSKEELSNFQKFLAQVDRESPSGIAREVYSTGQLLSVEYDRLPKDLAIGETITRIFRMSLNWNDPNFLKDGVYYGLFYCLRKILRSNSIDLIEKLSPKVQKEIWLMLRRNQAPVLHDCIDRGYLQLLLRSGYSTGRPNLSRESAEEYLSTMSKVRREHGLDTEIDSTRVTDEFLTEMTALFSDYDAYDSENFVKTFGPYLVEGVFMLREIYGESDVIEAFSHFTESQIALCPSELIRVLDDWENARNYPTEWIAEVYELHHTPVMKIQ